MIKSMTVTNYLGESLKLELGNSDDSGFLVQEISGLGPSKATINTTELSTNDGAIYNSARTASRNIVLTLVLLWNPTIEDSRQKSYKYFPIKKCIELLIETDNRICKTAGYVESNEPVIFSDSETTQISIICPDPNLYSAGDDGTKRTVFYGIESEFEFPFSNESLTQGLIEFGSIVNDSEKDIVYDGDEETGVTITIDALGSASGITIYNTGTREMMEIDSTKLTTITGADISVGDQIVICTVKGNKSITLLRNGVFTNILNCLSRYANWFQLAKGDNIFAFTATSGITNLQFRVENKMVYEGV